MTFQGANTSCAFAPALSISSRVATPLRSNRSFTKSLGTPKRRARVQPVATLQEKDASTDVSQSAKTDSSGAYFGEDETAYQPLLASALFLGFRNFGKEFRALVGELLRTMRILQPLKNTPPTCLGLTLSNEGIAARESEREAKEGSADVWPPVRLAYSTTCFFLDVIYEGRPIERFWVLETVARLPYLAYSSCLHLLGTLGWYRSATLMTLHRSEDLNENFHLAVMESLGGDQRWIDRFLAFHASLVYYWVLVALFFISPKQSYGFSLLLEAHACDTYGQFVDENAEKLKTLPVPEVAHVYFNDFLFYFQEFQVSEQQRGRPKLDSLYDVFVNILADEREHSSAMEACARYVEKGDPVVYNGKEVFARPQSLELREENRQKFWKEWERTHASDNKE